MTITIKKAANRAKENRPVILVEQRSEKSQLILPFNCMR